MKNPTIQEFRAFVIQNRAAVANLKQLRKNAAAAKVFVDANTAPVFARYQFVGRDGLPITSPAHVYLSTDEDMLAAFFAEVCAANVAAGWKGDPTICPFLAAQHAVIAAENALLKAGCKLFGTEVFLSAYGERRKEVLSFLSSPCA